MVRMARLAIVLGLVAGISLTAGCGDGPSAPLKSSGPAVKAAVEAAPPPPALAVPTPTTPVPEVAIKVVNSNDLEAAIKGQKGKIVVVDFWETNCIPCKREFPNLVAMHNKLGKDGVACMSVTVDPESKKDAALKFLKAQQAVFPNFLLNEEQSNWQERWKIKGIPVVYVYHRDGKRAKKFDNDDPDNQFTYEDVNKLVTRLLRGTE